VLALALLPREQAVGQREVGYESEPRALAFGKNVALWLAVQKAVLMLYTHEPRRAVACRTLRRTQMFGREVRAADLTHLASPHQFVEGAERVLDRHLGVGGVWNW
jgi:hypothetical protein